MTKEQINSMSAWERHGQTIIAALVLGAIVWVGKNVTELTGTMGVVLNRISNLETSIASMDERFGRYQTKAEARSATENNRLRLEMLNSQIEAIQAKIKK